MTDDDLKRPERTAGHAAHRVAATGLQFIPVAGTSATEIFAFLIQDPLSRRRDEWIERIAAAVMRLAEKVESIGLEDLADNDAFVTTLMNASQAAVRVHHEEKLEALRNVVLSAAFGPLEDDMELRFIEFVEHLTPCELHILSSLASTCFGGGDDRRPIPVKLSELASLVPQLEGKEPPEYGPLVSDLVGRGLVMRRSTALMGGGTTHYHISRLGLAFIEYIESPIDGSSPIPSPAGPPDDKRPDGQE